MNKQVSLELKGVAILMMVYLHLFNRKSNIGLVTDFCYINDVPLVYYIHYATHPVAFFLILSGFGLFVNYEKNEMDKNRVYRNIRLYVHYVFITLIFKCIYDFFVGGGKLRLEDVFLNLTGLKTSWNNEAWFLLPFVCLSLMYPYIFRTIRKVPTFYIFIGGYIVYFIFSFLIGRFDAMHYSNQWLFLILCIGHFLPMFLYGAIMKKSNIIAKNYSRFNSITLLFFLLVLMLLRCLLHDLWWGPIYAFVFIFLFALIQYRGIINKVLAFLGSHSMNIWLIHTWYCYYIFHDQIYSLKYPFLIYAATFAISLLTSIAFDFLFGKLLNKYW